jgi:hypothetical protein
MERRNGFFPRLFQDVFYGADLGHEKGDLRPERTFSGAISL